MPKQHPKEVFGPVINRIADVMAHSDQFAFKGVSRLARAAGVSPSSVSRLINGKMNPSFVMVARLTYALEQQFGYRIDPRDLVAENGHFNTPFVCDLAGCAGCLPEIALDEFGQLKSTYEGIKPGGWITSRYPRGYLAQKGNL